MTSKHSRIWVENALDVTGLEGPFELGREIEKGNVVDPGDMVDVKDALDMVEDYAEDSPVYCAECEIETIPMGEYGKWVCPGCEEIHVK